jgi:cytochrome c2
MKLPTLQTVAIAAGLVAGAYILHRVTSAGRTVAQAIGDAAGAAVDLVNPASDRNVVYQAVNVPARILTGNPNATVGTVLADVFQRDPGKVLNQYDAKRAAATGAGWTRASVDEFLAFARSNQLPTYRTAPNVWTGEH